MKVAYLLESEHAREILETMITAVRGRPPWLQRWQA